MVATTELTEPERAHGSHGDQHYAIYGSTTLRRAKCSECGCLSILLDGTSTCCGAISSFASTRIKRMAAAGAKRKRPSLSVRMAILERQAGRCFYCDRMFGTSIIRRGRLRVLEVRWDHFVPFSFIQSRSDENFVAACQICNGFKSNLIFDTPLAARAYLARRWALEIDLREA